MPVHTQANSRVDPPTQQSDYKRGNTKSFSTIVSTQSCEKIAAEAAPLVLSAESAPPSNKKKSSKPKKKATGGKKKAPASKPTGAEVPAAKRVTWEQSDISWRGKQWQLTIADEDSIPIYFVCREPAQRAHLSNIAQELLSLEKRMKEAAGLKDAVAVKDTTAVEDTTGVEDTTAVKDAVAVEDTTAVEDAVAVEDTAAVEDAVAVEDAGKSHCGKCMFCIL